MGYVAGGVLADTPSTQTTLLLHPPALGHLFLRPARLLLPPPFNNPVDLLPLQTRKPLHQRQPLLLRPLQIKRLLPLPNQLLLLCPVCPCHLLLLILGLLRLLARFHAPQRLFQLLLRTRFLGLANRHSELRHFGFAVLV